MTSRAQNLTAYGGLLPVATMLEKLQFQQLIEEHVTIKRLTTSMPGFRFVLAMILALYVGFSRLNHLQFLEREPMLTGILEVEELPVQSTFWRFLASLHLVVARQLLEVGRHMRQRVWEAAHVELKEVTLDTDTTVQTVYGRQMGARKGYNPQAPWEEELSADPDVSGRDAGIRGRGVAQRRPADGQTDRRASGERIRRAAEIGGAMLCAGGFGILLLGGGGGV